MYLPNGENQQDIFGWVTAGINEESISTLRCDDNTFQSLNRLQRIHLMNYKF